MKTLFAWLAAFTALLGAHTATAQDLPRARPDEVGFSSERLDHITRLLRDDATKGNAGIRAADREAR